MLKLISFLFFISYAIEGAPLEDLPHLQGRIIGGVNTTIAYFPYQVSVQYRGSHICGGSIVNNNWVLTSGTCSVYANTNYTVCAGSSTYVCSGTTHRVSNVTIHPKFDGSYDYDVAVIRVLDPFTYSMNVRAVPFAKSAPASHLTATVTGWGSLYEGGLLAPTLQYVEVLTISTQDCRDYYPKSSITQRMICTGTALGGRGPCDGDVGSPLVYNNEQVGIVSWGYGCARPFYPTVYTNVADLRSWIASTTSSASWTSAFTFTIFSAFLFALCTFYN